jgi:hypothetical protein
VSMLARVRVAVNAMAVAMPDRERGHRVTLVPCRGDAVSRLVELDVAKERV